MSSKNHYICIYPNNLNKGTIIDIRTNIQGELITEALKDFFNNNLNKKIILSTRNPESTLSNITIPVTLLSQRNLFENIKIIHNNNDNNLDNTRILIVKNNMQQTIFNKTNNTSINTNGLSKTNLINNLAEFYFSNDISLNIFNTSENLLRSPGTKSLILYNNYYIPCNNSDYYRFKFSDFAHELEKDNSYMFKLVGDISLINTYNISYDDEKFDKFKTLYNFKDNGNIILDKDISNISILNESVNYSHDSSDNILIYNQHENTSIVRFELLKENSPTYTTIIDSSYIFFKSVRDYGYLNDNTGKIYLNENLLYFNTNVINKNNNFYSINKHLDDNMIYLSFGKNITGITKYNIDSKMIFTLNNNKLAKIYFKNISTSVANNEEKYLVNENYNFNYTNILSYRIINKKNKKDDTTNIKGLFDISNIYKNEFNSYALITNTITGDNLQLGSNNISKYWNNNYNDISFNFINKRKIINDYNTRASNDITLDILGNKYKIDYFNFYNSIIFDISVGLKYNINYNDISFNFFNNIYFTTYLEVIDINDFRFANCIFTYYNPYDKSTSDAYRYPNNNIDICYNPSIDSLSRAIELQRGTSSQSDRNGIIIPTKNSSNLSRKAIQGLIGMNKIPQLLSIEPYDENFIIGRGFINQYQIDDKCKSDSKIINNKYISQKYSNIKNKQNNVFSIYNTTKKQEYANTIRNNNKKIRNKRINDLASCKLATNLPSNSENYITRFTNQMWKK
tara:strand:+ start:19700 stop:21919 length:2220 start_codon:yes stop_codon:yes gene_type:complete